MAEWTTTLGARSIETDSQLQWLLSPRPEIPDTLTEGTGTTELLGISISAAPNVDASVQINTVTGAGELSTSWEDFDSAVVFEVGGNTLTLPGPNSGHADMSISDTNEPYEWRFTSGSPTYNDIALFIITFGTISDDDQKDAATLTLRSLNRSPVITNPGDKTYTQGEIITPFTISITDPDRDALTVSAVGLPANLNFDTTTYQVSGMIDDSVTVGLHTVTVTANDGVNADVTMQFNIAVRSPLPGGVAAREAGFGLSGRQPVYALEIEHPDVTDNIRVINDTQDAVIEMNTYTAMAFRARLPQQREGEVLQASVEIDNVGQAMVEWVEASGGGRGATMRMMEIVFTGGGSTDIVWEVDGLDVGQAQLTNETFSVTLTDASATQSNAVKLRHDPNESPGLF